jgi:hypothetical protein
MPVGTYAPSQSPTRLPTKPPKAYNPNYGTRVNEDLGAGELDEEEVAPSEVEETDYVAGDRT